jgi:membrane dipeptidase
MRPVFDGHNDALTADEHAQLASGKSGGHLDLPRMRAAGVRGAIFAVFADGPDGDHRLDGADPQLHRLWGQPLPEPLEHAWAAGVATRAAGRLAALELAGEVTIARTTSDLDAVHDDPALPPAAVLHVEGAEAIDPELETLPFWYEAGLRSLGPVWSRPNWFGEGVPFRAPSSPDTGGGLTEAGGRLVARCGELGILVDLSHLNEQGFWDVARIDAGPLVASHAGAHALSQNSRNLTDRQLDAIGSSGGLIGIVYAPAFLREDFAEALDTPIALIARHAAYVAERIGVDHVGLGSDFDGTLIPDELGDVEGVPRLLDALAGVGFSDAEIDAIAWDNWRRVFGVWWRD